MACVQENVKREVEKRKGDGPPMPLGKIKFKDTLQLEGYPRTGRRLPTGVLELGMGVNVYRLVGR